MYRLVRVSGPAHAFLWAHGVASVASMFALRAAMGPCGINQGCLVSFLVCCFSVAINRTLGRRATPAPAATFFGAAIAGLEWPAAEALTAMSFAFNPLSVHLPALLALLSVFSLPGLVLQPRATAVADSAELWRRRLRWAGGAVLAAGLGLALAAAYGAAYRWQSTASLAALLALIYGRADRDRTRRQQQRQRCLARRPEGEEGWAKVAPPSVAVSPAALVALPLASALLLDDYRFVRAGDWPSPAAVVLLLVGCAGRAAAQSLLDTAMFLSRRCGGARVTRRDQVALLAAEFFLGYLLSCYFLGEHMSLGFVLPTFLGALCLLLYWACLEGSVSWVGLALGLPDGGGEDGEGSTADTLAIRTVASLHNGFYVA